MAAEPHANTRIRASVHSVHSTFYLTGIFFIQEEIDNNKLSMRFYYGHYGQPHETLQTQGL